VKQNLRKELKEHKNLIYYDDYQYQKVERIKYIILGGLITAGLIYVFYRSIWLVFLAILAGVLTPKFIKKHLAKARQRRLNLEFKEAMEGIAAALSAGYSVENAMKVTCEELGLLFGRKSDIYKEFRYMNEQLRMNINIEQVLAEFAMRSKLEDVLNFADSFAIARRSGGDLTVMTKNVAMTISEKIKTEQEIAVLIAGKKLEQRLMILMLPAIVLYLNFFSPEFTAILYEGIIGRVVMSITLMGYIISIYWSNRLVDIRV
jgi:Flp pilus assembly protein TadB